METTDISLDPFWDCKMERSSPLSGLLSPFNSEDSWLTEDNFATDVLIFDDFIDNISPDEIPTDCLGVDIKIEQWLEERPGVASFPDYIFPLLQPQSIAAELKTLNPYEIIMELDNEFCGQLTQLTPPQTPPRLNHNNNNTIFNNFLQDNVIDVVKDKEIPKLFSTQQNTNIDSQTITVNTNDSVPIDVAREIQIIDEILRSRAKELPDWADDESINSMSSSSQSHSNDEDWIPTSSTSDKKEICYQKKRTRPYSRNVDDRKIRKKEQNKNAATRYRQKKKQEMEEILEEERLLTLKNEKLTKNLTDIENEVKYLKKLIRELYKSRKIVSKN